MLINKENKQKFSGDNSSSDLLIGLILKIVYLLIYILLKVLKRENIITPLKNNGYLSQNLCNFISGKSTTWQLLSVLENWTKARDNGHEINSIYIDFMKVFDTVLHTRFIKKLENFKIVVQMN